MIEINGFDTPTHIWISRNYSTPRRDALPDFVFGGQRIINSADMVLVVGHLSEGWTICSIF